MKKIIAALSFIASIVAPLVFLPIKWALFCVFLVSVLSPMLSMLFIGVFESLRLPVKSGLFVGFVEAWVFVFFAGMAPPNFLYIASFVYVINQLGRVVIYTWGTIKLDSLETKMLIGFLLGVVLSLLV